MIAPSILAPDVLRRLRASALVRPLQAVLAVALAGLPGSVGITDGWTAIVSVSLLGLVGWVARDQRVRTPGEVGWMYRDQKFTGRGPADTADILFGRVYVRAAE